MTYLETSLKKYYQRKGNKLLFINGMSLNKMALQMWELLDYSQIDASVLSKVIHGTRTFNTTQLDTFCDILKISVHERELLHYSLYLDSRGPGRSNIDIMISSGADIIDTSAKFLTEANNLLLSGKHAELNTLTSILSAQLLQFMPISFKSNHKRELGDMLAKSLYLQGRALGSIGTSETIIADTSKITQIITNLPIIEENSPYLGYVNVLLSNAHYVAGNYLNNKRVTNDHYKISIDYANRAICLLPEDNPETLFAYRTLLASAINSNNQPLFVTLSEMLEKKLSSISQRYYLNGLHLYSTIAKGKAYFKIGDPIKTEEIAEKHFNRNLVRTHIYEVSDVRNQLEIFKLLKIKDKHYLQNRVYRALDIADEEHYIRHVININKLIQEIY